MIPSEFMMGKKPRNDFVKSYVVLVSWLFNVEEFSHIALLFPLITLNNLLAGWDICDIYLIYLLGGVFVVFT